jgi:hypothetical protein
MVPLCLQHEGAAAAMQCSADLLDRHVPGRALDARERGQHLALAGRLEIAVELLDDDQPAEYCPLSVVVRLRGQVHVEVSDCPSRHAHQPSFVQKAEGGDDLPPYGIANVEEAGSGLESELDA